eukprot:gb/GEZN01017026.1/.p1 GENE.gb/GEZN01017026.1/~~gb/GEZN01017026.1/.p1  ORF type:complete len:179 (-),score=38.32 gb/GEZN01017026.1/:254-790(-)
MGLCGSKKQGDDKIPEPKNLKEKLELQEFYKRFALLDVDKNGYLTPDEISRMLTEILQIGISPDDAKKIVDKADKDGDGKISKGDLWRLMKEGKHLDDGLELQSAEMQKVYKNFRILDQDGSGEIDAKDLQTLFSKVYDMEVTEEQCRKIIKGHDKDGDKTIHYDEFCRMIKSGERLL